MNKRGITHERGTAEYVVQHAAWQESRGRKPSQAFMEEKNPRDALQRAEHLTEGRCGCGGEIVPGYGCDDYGSSEWFYEDVLHESMRRTQGLGFGVGLTSDNAAMSMHLQRYGMPFERTEETLLAPIQL